jgi:hypothetical protein
MIVVLVIGCKYMKFIQKIEVVKTEIGHLYLQGPKPFSMCILILMLQFWKHL